MPSCSEILDSAITYARIDSDKINSAMQALADSCDDEYDIAVGYVSHATDAGYSSDSCEELLGWGTPTESVDLLENDGWCRYGAYDAEGETSWRTAGQGSQAWPEGGIGWDGAAAHAGEVQRVCGPLMSMRETADGTFVNVGEDYPSASRFTFIFWDIYLEPINAGATLCGSGEIYLYDGVAQMEMYFAGDLEIWQSTTPAPTGVSSNVRIHPIRQVHTRRRDTRGRMDVH